MDVRLVLLRIVEWRQAEPGEARIAGVTRVAGRHGIASEREEIERASLEAVRDLLVAAQHFDQIVAVARLLQQLRLFVVALAGERILLLLEQADQLRLALGRDRELRDEFAQRLGVEQVRAEVVGQHGHRVAGGEHVAPERLACKEHPARQLERRIEPALEGGIEARDVDAEILEQTLGHGAVERLGRLQRLAAAVAQDQAAIEAELVALGVAAEVVVVVQDQDSRPAIGAPVEPGRRQAADAAADHDQIVALVDRQSVEGRTSCRRAGHGRPRTSRRDDHACR